MGNEFSNIYDMDKHIPEIYDQLENGKNDIDFLLNKLKKMNSPKILEPFCGTGRLLLPLAKNGYKITGIDISRAMLEHLKTKINRLDKSIQNNIELIQDDVLNINWPKAFDLIILGCNCLYELPTSQTQKTVIEKAFNSLNPGGLLFIDNDNMEGLLDKSWCDIGVKKKIFPSGICSHGVKIQGFAKAIWVDRKKRLWKAKRRIEVIYPNGKKEEKTYIQQKHPVSAEEIKGWLNEFGFEILEMYSGLKQKEKFKKGSKRVTFLARKTVIDNNFNVK